MLPQRDGVGASCVGLPPGPWSTMLDFLVDRFPHQDRAIWMARMNQGRVMDEHGVPVTDTRPYQAHLRLYYYRSVDDEPRIPFDAVVLHQDAHLVVVDKPHFLPVVPSGPYLQETVLVRLKRQLGIDTLVPLHRIDRDTAGLVLFSVQVASRGAYHALFREHRMRKCYEAIAPWRADLALPLTRTSRIGEGAHFMQRAEVEGAANAQTEITLLERAGSLARYALEPVTGQRHQLRVHMNALGLPIVNDGIYPTLTPQGATDTTRPLQLLARSVAFTDPLSGKPRYFESRQRLDLARVVLSARGPYRSPG